MHVGVVVTPDGAEPFQLDIGMRDVVRWERSVRGASMALLNKPTAAVLYSLAHSVCVKRGLYVGTLAEFEDQCEVDPLGSTDPDPTLPEVSLEA